MSSPTTLDNLLLLGLGLQEELTHVHAGRLLEGGDLGVREKPGLAAAVAWHWKTGQISFGNSAWTQLLMGLSVRTQQLQNLNRVAQTIRTHMVPHGDPRPGSGAPSALKAPGVTPYREPSPEPWLQSTRSHRPGLCLALPPGLDGGSWGWASGIFHPQ